MASGCRIGINMHKPDERTNSACADVFNAVML
jgi:hypothetical protein